MPRPPYVSEGLVALTAERCLNTHTTWPHETVIGGHGVNLLSYQMLQRRISNELYLR